MMQITELPEDTKSAIIHLCNLLNRDGLTYSQLQIGAVGISSFLCGELEETVRYDTHNPIQAVLDSVFEEVCTDCLKLDYYFQDPFFVSLIKGYIEGLIAKFGNEVPVTETIARVCLIHPLTKHSIGYRAEYGSGLLHIIDDANHQAFDENQAWFLKVKNDE